MAHTYSYLYNVPENESINYSWSVENGNLIAGPSVYSAEIQWGSPGTGKIKVWSTDDRGCRSDTVTLAVSVSSTGILQYQQQDYHVYPVPARDRISVSNLESAVDYAIWGLTGQLVASGRLEVNATLNIAEMPAGTYIIKLTEEKVLKHSEVFIKH